MIHDPLCGWHTKTGCFDEQEDCFECVIIAKVRKALGDGGMKYLAISKTGDRFLDGYVQGLYATAWECGDCGNLYEATVYECPNSLLHDAAARAMRQRAQR